MTLKQMHMSLNIGSEMNSWCDTRWIDLWNRTSLLLRDRLEAPIEVDSATSISGLRTMDADTPSYRDLAAFLVSVFIYLNKQNYD